MTIKYDKHYKILLLGDTYTGKSALLKRYCKSIYNIIPTTIGIDFEHKTIKYKNNMIKLVMWDPSGSECMRLFINNYYNGVDAIILMYDITFANTYYNLNSWIKNIKLHVNNDVPIFLVGNKLDLEIHRKIEKKKMLNFSKKHNMNFLEISVKNNKNIDELFNKLLDKLINKKKKVGHEVKNN